MATSDFVTQLFQNIYGRVPTATELSLWVGRIDSGAEFSTQVALDIINAPEGVNAAAIERLYQAAFGRTPDLAGFKVQVGSGIPASTLAQNFVASAEFQATFVGNGTFDVSNFITKLYNNVLGRDPDAGGMSVQVNFYNSLIGGGQSATQARATLLQNFANSAEFVANTSINFDKVVLAFAGIDNTIPVSTTASPNLTLQQAGDLPLGMIAGALNDGVNGNGFKISSINNQIQVAPGLAGTVIQGTANSDTFVASWTSINNSAFNGNGGHDILLISDTANSANVSLDGVGQVSIVSAASPVTLTLNIANASSAGHIDTLSLTGGDVNKVTIAAAGVENIIYDSNNAQGGVFDFTGSTSLANLTVRGAQSFAISGFAGDGNPNLKIDASAATGVGSIDARTYNSSTGVVVLGGAGGTGTGSLQGSGNADLIRGGAGADAIIGGGGADNLTGGGGDDVFTVSFSSTTAANDSTTTAFDTITDFSKAASASATSGFDAIKFVDAASALTTSLAPNATNISSGTNWTVSNGLLSFTGGTAITTLAGAVAIADVAAVGSGNVVAFVFGGDAYVFEQNSGNDALVKLAGIASIGSVNVSNGLVFLA